jgi:hypothetical protein
MSHPSLQPPNDGITIKQINDKHSEGVANKPYTLNPY